MTRNNLTAKQQEFVDYVKAYQEENDGNWPRYKDAAEHFGYKSPNSITQLLKALKKKKVIVEYASGFRWKEEMPARAGIPIKGQIAAGQLNEAVEADLGSITLEALFPNIDRMFALRVSGQSMSGAEINSGDYVLLVDEDIPNGGIGAVLYNGETSLKRIYMDENGLRLEPANPDYGSIHVQPGIFEEVLVLGRYVGHVNRRGVHTGKPTAVQTSSAANVTHFRPRL